MKIFSVLGVFIYDVNITHIIKSFIKEDDADRFAELCSSHDKQSRLNKAVGRHPAGTGRFDYYTVERGELVE